MEALRQYSRCCIVGNWTRKVKYVETNLIQDSTWNRLPSPRRPELNILFNSRLSEPSHNTSPAVHMYLKRPFGYVWQGCYLHNTHLSDKRFSPDVPVTSQRIQCYTLEQGLVSYILLGLPCTTWILVQKYNSYCRSGLDWHWCCDTPGPILPQEIIQPR